MALLLAHNGWVTQNLNINMALINTTVQNGADPGMVDFLERKAMNSQCMPDLYRHWAKFFSLWGVLKSLYRFLETWSLSSWSPYSPLRALIGQKTYFAPMSGRP